MLLRISVLLAAIIPVSAAEWSWTWKPAPGDKTATASVSACKYGKMWAYAVEIDDGPKWVRSFAVPFLARYHYTDAPPGVAGGKPLPFVGSVAAVVGAIGFNDRNVDWDDLKALTEAGWGVMNHSFDHRGLHWQESGKLSDREVADDAYWSQTILAAGLPGGRAPTGAVYANGYVDYNRNDVLAKAGIGIATRVGGSSTRDLGSPTVQWMDFTRSYLDDGVWVKDHAGAVMAQFPGAEQDGPEAGNLVIDFTHGIDQQADSANQQRWSERLSTIERRWGAGGGDTLWCAPTAEVADYVRAATAAKITISSGKLTVRLPDDIPGSALTLRLSGIGTRAQLQAPVGGALYRLGDVVVLTSPVIGLRGAVPPAPRLSVVYDGPAVSVDFAKPTQVAGITIGVAGCPQADATYRLAVRTAKGDQQVGQRTLTGGTWVVGSQLCPIVPSAPAITGRGITVEAVPELRRMIVWAVETARR
jgi:hypothetical protein